MDWLSFTLGALSVVAVEFVLLVGFSVAAYRKRTGK